MKFGKTLVESTLKEWKFYYVDYKELKQTLKNEFADDDNDIHASFDEILRKSEEKMAKFMLDRESWAISYLTSLEKRVQQLRESASQPSSPSSLGSNGSISSLGDDGNLTAGSPTGIADLQQSLERLSKTTINGEASYLKDAYRRMGMSKHFQDYIYSKKALVTFQREIDLLLEFLEINKMAFSKILKKFDKKTGQVIREKRFKAILDNNSFLKGEKLRSIKKTVLCLIDEVCSLKPRLPEGWEQRKVYTIGCFDLFHRGHQNVLMSLREFGAYVVAGIHDDDSYFKLKAKCTIENLETRMENVKPFVDQIFVIPSTDPLLYIKSMVSDQDIANGSCCYARGDDMLDFPGREWVESVMPVHFVPRTEACSSVRICSSTLRCRSGFLVVLNPDVVNPMGTASPVICCLSIIRICRL
jgi:cytidyltransferase-like protein